MATLTENRMMNMLTVEQEAELHNAQIRERYQRLQNAEADQFASETPVARVENTIRSSVLAPEKPLQAETAVPAVAVDAQVTEFTRERIQSPVFTTEKFDRIAETNQAAAIPVQNVQERTIQMHAPTMVAHTEAQYSLSAMAKMVLAAFTALVVVMLAVICINTNILHRQSVRIRNLEDKREELVERNEEIQQRISEAKSEETIREYALSQGMIEGN